MLSRTVRRSILDTKFSSSALPPTFLLPSRARYLQSTAQHVETPPQAIDPSQLPFRKLPPPRRAPPTQPESIAMPLILDSTIREMLPLLSTQPSHYVNIHIHGKPYLVTAGDTVRLPFHMPGVVPGDVLRLNRATALGSRDYTLKGTPYIDERLFECRARITGTESEPMRTKEKKKRRNRRINTVKSKLRFTVMTISELKINRLEDLEKVEQNAT
ncbi:ribosomal protein L21-like protein [Amylocarpus encephaloides]|uniref:Large ribosomal subunit protein bL21m n=1 Tax=Amylocarpus encephaloides TaxID=45428 RepID=A0A9P7YDF9_9HELO|nr:ribosomal protein L21-like protein [Amylocarpus encephaloides]